MQGVCNRSCFDGRIHQRWHIQPRADQVAVLECGWRDERIRLGKRSRLEQQHRVRRGEFPLPARPSAKSAGQSMSKPPSMTRAQQTEEAYPDLSNLKREPKRAQREKNKANLDRDQAKLERSQANLERDQAIIERDQARRDLDMLKTEYQQGQKVREKRRIASN